MGNHPNNFPLPLLFWIFSPPNLSGLFMKWEASVHPKNYRQQTLPQLMNPLSLLLKNLSFISYSRIFPICTAFISSFFLPPVVITVCFVPSFLTDSLKEHQNSLYCQSKLCFHLYPRSLGDFYAFKVWVVLLQNVLLMWLPLSTWDKIPWPPWCHTSGFSSYIFRSLICSHLICLLN